MHIQSSRYGRQSFHQWQMTSPSCHVWRFNPQPLYTPDVCESSLEILSRKETLQKRFGSESFWHSTLVAKMIQASCLVFASFQWLNFKGWFNKDRTFFSNSGCWSLNAAVIKNVRGVPQALLNFTLNPCWPSNKQASRTVRPRPAANNLALSGMLAASLTLMRWSCDQKKRNQLWCGQTRDNGLKSILHTCPTKSCKIINSQTYVFNNHQKFPTKIIRCYYTGCILYMLYQLYYFWIYARLTTPFAEMQWHKSLKLWKNFLNLWRVSLFWIVALFTICVCVLCVSSSHSTWITHSQLTAYCNWLNVYDW